MLRRSSRKSVANISMDVGSITNFSPITRRKSTFHLLKTPVVQVPSPLSKETTNTPCKTPKTSTATGPLLALPLRSPKFAPSPSPFRTPRAIVPATPVPKSSSITFSTPKAAAPENVNSTPKTIYTDPVMAKIMKDINSPSAAARIRANRALKSPVFRKAAYQQFDVAHEFDEFVMTEEQRKPAPPKSVKEVFKNCKIYVEARTGDDNRSAGIKNRLLRDGITVNEKLYKDTTHVIFKDGLLSTYKNAKKLQIPIVTILWIDACVAQRRLVETEKFKISNIERYERPELFKRLRRQKSVQPEMSKLVSTPTLERSLSQDDYRGNGTIVEDEEEMELTLQRSQPSKDMEVEKIDSDLEKWRASIRRFTTFTPNPMEQTGAIERRKTVFCNETSSSDTNTSSKTIVFNSTNKIAPNSRRSVFDISMNLIEMNCKAMSSKKDDDVWEQSPQKRGTPVLPYLSTQVGKVAEVRKRKLFNDFFGDEGKENSQENDKSLKPVDKKRKSLKLPETFNISKTAEKKKKTASDLQRRETIAFFKPKEVSTLKPKSPAREPTKFIVCTNMSGTDKQIMHAAILKLGGRVEMEVTSRTTHVVTPNEDRTMNILRGVIRACVIINTNWIHSSVSQDKWLDTTLYRHNICDMNRVHERAVLGSKVYINNTFSLHGPFYISKETIDSAKKVDYVKEVISLCGGRTTDFVSESNIIVSDQVLSSNKTVVTSTHIFDSAMKGTFQEPMKYAPKSKKN